MAQFITRVELHGATYQDYENLHREMEGRGFSRSIPADSGTWYQLPTAEYWINNSGQTRDTVLAAADAAANATGKTHGVIVTESNGCSWRGLPNLN
jgi:hypothetical protein